MSQHPAHPERKTRAAHPVDPADNAPGASRQRVQADDVPKDPTHDDVAPGSKPTKSDTAPTDELPQRPVASKAPLPHQADPSAERQSRLNAQGRITQPRPGHADAQRGQPDMGLRPVLEKAKRKPHDDSR